MRSQTVASAGEGESRVCVECRRPNNVGADVIVTCVNIGPQSDDRIMHGEFSGRVIAPPSFKKDCSCVILT